MHGQVIWGIGNTPKTGDQVTFFVKSWFLFHYIICNIIIGTYLVIQNHFLRTLKNCIPTDSNWTLIWHCLIHQLWILSRLHSYFRASAFIILILFIVQWNGDLNLWSQYHHCLLLLFLITITVISCSGTARGFDQCPSWVSIQKASFDPIRSFTLSN